MFLLRLSVVVCDLFPGVVVVKANSIVIYWQTKDREFGTLEGTLEAL
jgi:hypothetical protein